MVVRESGSCIEGATLEIVSGPDAGRTMTQDEPCGVWDYGGEFFTGLLPGVAITVRASAVGYVTLEKTVTPSTGGREADIFVLTPVPH